MGGVTTPSSPQFIWHFSRRTFVKGELNMQHRLYRSTFHVASALALAIGADANAQTEGAGISEIIVTARRVEESLQDVPISMTVVDPGQIADRNIVVAADLATYTPSLSVNQRYGAEKSTFAIRGFNQDQSTAPTVGVYFADVVGVRSQGGTTSGNTVGAGAFTDLQNVQILKASTGHALRPQYDRRRGPASPAEAAGFFWRIRRSDGRRLRSAPRTSRIECPGERIVQTARCGGFESARRLHGKPIGDRTGGL